MGEMTPEDTVRNLIKAINNDDAATAAAQYEPEAILVVEPGKIARGSEQIREAMIGFTALKPTLQSEKDLILVAGDTALLLSNWSLNGTGPEGEAIQMGGKSTDILRRQSGGNWLIAIDNPWGVDLLG